MCLLYNSLPVNHVYMPVIQLHVYLPIKTLVARQLLTMYHTVYVHVSVSHLGTISAALPGQAPPTRI